MGNKTYSKEVQEGLLMSFPQIACHILPESGFCLGPKRYEGFLRIRPQTKTGTNLNPYRCRFIDLEVNVRMLKKSKSQSNTANSTANYGEFDPHWS